jgi:hypothetical protein
MAFVGCVAVRFGQRGQGVVANGFMDEVAGRIVAVARHDERLVDEPDENSEYAVPATRSRCHHTAIDTFEIATAAEDAKMAQDVSLVAIEQLEAPLHRLAQGLMAGRRGRRTADEHPEPVIQATDQFPEAQPAQLGGRQLDGQWETVESSAELDDRLRIVGAELVAGPTNPARATKSRTASVACASFRSAPLPAAPRVAAPCRRTSPATSGAPARWRPPVSRHSR